MATVTVTIPTWNRSRLVRDAIDSVLSQTFSDWDLVVLDNASTDDTVAMVEAYADPRIRLIRHEQNMGLVKNVNSALKAGAESRYTALLMSDDVMYPTNLERKVDFLDRHPEAGMVHSAYKLVGNDGNVLSELSSMAWPNQNDSIESSTVFMRRSFEFPCSRVDVLRGDEVRDRRPVGTARSRIFPPTIIDCGSRRAGLRRSATSTSRSPACASRPAQAR